MKSVPSLEYQDSHCNVVGDIVIVRKEHNLYSRKDNVVELILDLKWVLNDTIFEQYIENIDVTNKYRWGLCMVFENTVSEIVAFKIDKV